MLESLIQPVENADRLWQEMQILQRQLDDLEYKLDVRSQGAKSLEEIQTELNNLQETRYKKFSGHCGAFDTLNLVPFLLFKFQDVRTFLFLALHPMSFTSLVKCLIYLFLSCWRSAETI